MCVFRRSGPFILHYLVFRILTMIYLWKDKIDKSMIKHLSILLIFLILLFYNPHLWSKISIAYLSILLAQILSPSNSTQKCILMLWSRPIWHSVSPHLFPLGPRLRCWSWEEEQDWLLKSCCLFVLTLIWSKVRVSTIFWRKGLKREEKWNFSSARRDGSVSISVSLHQKSKTRINDCNTAKCVSYQPRHSWKKLILITML